MAAAAKKTDKKPENKLGEKRSCLKCSAKFYDLNKSPILCPKCGATHDPEAVNKSRRGRKKASEKEDNIPEEMELDLEGMEEIEELEELDEDDANVIEELDEEIRDEMEVDDEANPENSDKLLVDLESDADDIIDGGDEISEKDKD